MRIFIFFFLGLLIFPLQGFSQSPNVVNQSSNTVKCAGADMDLFVKATGSGTLNYQWYKDSLPIGGNTDTLSFTNIADSLEGYYYCEVSNTYGSDQSVVIQVIVVNNPPVINSATPDSSYCNGSNTSININAVGDVMSFSWQLNGSTIPEYGSSISINNISASDTGVYYCNIQNVCGSTDTSISVSLSGYPQILSSPVSQTVCEGDDATFTISADGTNLQYQWYNDTVPVSGGTDSVLTIPNVSAGFSGMISCKVFNPCDTLHSGQVNLNVITKANITAHPISGNYCVGEEITLISTATGTPPVGMQWYKDGNPVTDSTDNTLTITTQPFDTAYYYVAFMNQCGTIFSDSAEIVTDMPPVILQQPYHETACVGDTLNLAIEAEGVSPISYQWQSGGVDVQASNITGDQTSNMIFNGINSGQDGFYQCVVTNYCGSTLTDSIEVDVLLPPSVISQPDSLTVCEGDTAELNLNVNGSAPLSYNWINDFNNDTLANSQDMIVNGITENYHGEYYCIVSNQCADVSTDTVDLNVNTYPEFNTQPSQLDICQGDSASLIISAEGTEPVDYLWFKDQSALSAETDSILTFNPAQIGQTGNYLCAAMNMCGITQSDEVMVNVGTLPTVLFDPSPKEICENETLILYSNATGQNVFYQWYLNDQPITGQDDTTLFIPYADDSLSGEYYFQAYNGCASVNSDTVHVEVKPAPEIDLGNDQDLCDGDEVILSAYNDSIQSYEWNNGESTSANYTADETGDYYLSAIGYNGCTGYDTVHLEFHPVHYVYLGIDSSYCGSHTLDADTGAYSYSWNTGDTTHSINVTESGKYYVTTEGDEYGCTHSDTVDLLILDKPDLELGQNDTITEDTSLNICAGEEFYSYYWHNGKTDSCINIQGNQFGTGTHDVWLKVEYQNGCSDTDSIKLTVEEGNFVQKLKKGEKIHLYPNPAKGKVFIDYKLTENSHKISILNIDGRKIYQTVTTGKNNRLSLNIESLSAGYYILNIKTDSRSFNMRLVKK